ncbi:MAG: thrombospondin type 3 repeat-containing protein, partial [Ruminococcus sp.]|nr:thrombospondin type 3 repeat-containing protein [Ruminococcus sp.]
MRKFIKRAVAGIAALTVITASMPSAYFSGTSNAAGNILAFPGAVGGGKYATGGRGGEVYHVTNLNDSGAGSFRDAVSKSNRIVVFDVSGTIELKSNILCSGNVTIAGQTAPGGSGITLKNYKMGMSGDNIICRYISSRPGPYAATSSGNDAWGGAKGSDSIIDHCSMGWTTDEQWGLYSNNMNYTVQYSVLGPADSWGGHKKGLHGFGLMMGKGNLTFDHNLIIHNVSRNFRGKVQSTYTADFTNNIIYDWGYQTAYGTIGHLNYVNNTLKAGNSTTGGYHWINVDSGTSPQNFKIYCDGNQLINKDGLLHAITQDNWAGVDVKESIGITKDDLYSASPFGIDINGENVSSVAGAESAEASYEHVISFAGNGIAPDKRTAVDLQCAEETRNGTGSCSGTSEYDSSMTDLDKYKIQCGITYEYPAAVLKKEIVDSDNDGMPDDWELARGLNPNDASDYKGDYCGQGYMNIEYYIN